MLRHSLALAGFLALGADAALASSTDVTHYAAKPSETLAEAVANFSEYNALLAEVMARPTLTDSDLERIHELTYTLETALARINAAMADLPERLERVHLASEGHEAPDRVRALVRTYLDPARTVIP